MGNSRLDRLFVLIETGSSPVTRRAASQQLGEIVKYHPSELQHLLNRVFILLSSSSWDTRIAAAQAVEASCLNTPQWIPPEKIKAVDRLYYQQMLSFKSFDMQAILTNCVPLMASDNLEHLLHTDDETVKKQVEMINSNLNMGVAVEKIVSDVDITSSFQYSSFDVFSKKKLISEVLNVDKLGVRETIVERKVNQVSNEKLSQESGRNSRKTSNSPEKCYSEVKRVKVENDDGLKSPSDCIEGELDWPFELFTSKLKQSLFSSKWEIRHGAACALREIMKVHGKTAGYCADLDRNQMEENHQLWLEDLVLRLLCVLALDRFGDFISDQVVAPVRETCAQCLGIAINLMSENRVLQTVHILMHLLKESEWEIRHGALLGIKYMLAVREDLQDEILTEVFPLILKCFGDPIDDVSAEAASALNPVCVRIVKLMPQVIPDLINELWNLLSSQDELGVACNSFMTLLASLFMNADAQACVSSEMVAKIIPYLWTFLYYNATSVRKSALQTICCITNSKLCISRWNKTLLQNTMRHVFQRVLLEPSNEIRSLAEEAWNNIIRHADVSILINTSQEYFGIWLCLSMQPSKLSFDESLLILDKKKSSSHNELIKSDCTELKLYLGGNETVPAEFRENNVVPIRCMAARLLGSLLNVIFQPLPESGSLSPNSFSGISIKLGVEGYCSSLMNHLNSKSALQRMMAALVLNEWAQQTTNGIDDFPQSLKDRLLQCLSESFYFDEIASSYTKVLQDAKDFIALLIKNCVPVDESLCNRVLRLNEIESLTSDKTYKAVTDAKLDKSKLKEIQDKRQAINSVIGVILAEQSNLTISTQAIIAGAVLNLKCLPSKLNPVIKPLMDAIKKEENECLQKMAASHLAGLVQSCINRDPSPNTKIIINLCSFLCSDPDFTPPIHSPSCSSRKEKVCDCDKYNGILTLSNQLKISDKFGLKRQSSSNSIRPPGRPPLVDFMDENSVQQNQLQRINKIQRRGASEALVKIAELQGERLITEIPVLWNLTYSTINDMRDNLDKNDPLLRNNDDLAEKLTHSLQLFEILCPVVHEELLTHIVGLLNTLCLCLNHPYCAVRHMAARCIAVLAKRDMVAVMEKIPTLILPYMNAADSVTKRQGGIETIAALVENLKLDIVPYIVLFVIPLLGRMSDQDELVRSMASHTFGMVIQLMPLECASPSPLSLSAELLESVEEQRSFLNQLLNPKCIPDFELSVQINAELRSYQQCGVNWLAFLNKYHLHGILCDDMGLGKTLQSLCILAEDHYQRELLYETKKRADAVTLPSLVVCPPTLIGHWVYEIKKFVPHRYLKPLQYEGIPAERERLRCIATKHNLIVASYDIVRKDCDFFSSVKWNYCILDEGHIIKNDKTKISKAIKKLVANHRLILSGTPIQNNVLELWSLFDFLMPGYLGNEKQFSVRFSKPILSSRDPKSSLKEQEAGIMAMEALHQKVLPFILRRMKGDVLKDLPPKITQDYYCELSPIQQILYEDFSNSEIQKNTINAIKTNKSCNSFSMFQALRYLQSVCNHPKLVLTPQHPLHGKIMCQLEAEKSSLSDIKHAAKLIALKQLLIDCGIGASTEIDDVTKTSCIVSQHRALIFCQLKAMLDILEKDFFKIHLPSVTYLRLDGSVSVNDRHKIVTSFNEDPSIDVLLLTTQIGGLGLNLTGADTVIFVEHDWSPMKDLQAMDRAHRIGQKKVVNVYRLITRATLEQKIMGLQEFKLKTANTVITAENSNLSTMSTEKLLDLFSFNTIDSDRKDASDADSSKRTNTANEFMKSLPELWDTKDYEEEYDMTSFISSLRQ